MSDRPPPEVVLMDEPPEDDGGVRVEALPVSAADTGFAAAWDELVDYVLRSHACLPEPRS